MGRAYEVRKMSIQKTGAAKAKVYSMYAREIYQAAKIGGTSPDGNLTLRRLIEKAKEDQVPSDIIKRAIDKVNSGDSESYEANRYELFGPGGSTLIVDCLTDNVNRTVSNLRAALNKTNTKMGSMGSVGYMYDNFSVVSFKGLSEEETLELLLDKGIDLEDLESNELITVYGKTSDLYEIKEAIKEKIPNVSFEVAEITTIPKDTIKLTGEDLEYFNKLLLLLDDIEDVKNVYHNVELI